MTKKKKREDAQMLSRRGFLNSAFGARSGAHNRATSAGADARRSTRAQAPDRRRAGAFVEGGIAGLAMGSRQNAANAGAVHHREAGAVDGRGRRRSRRDRAAVLARRPQRLWNRSGETIPRSLRG